MKIKFKLNIFKAFIVNKRSKAIFFIAILLAIFSFLVTLLRAANTGLTYDEAYTYLYYAKDLKFNDFLPFFINCLANNHWMNTIFIKLVQGITKVYYNEFFIRLPSIIFYAFYLTLLLYMLYKKHISFFGFSLFSLIFYLNEFFGLARGYGIAVFLILLACYFYYMWNIDNGYTHSYLTLSMLFFIMSTTAITTTLLIFLSFAVPAFIILMKKHSLYDYIKKQWYWLIPMALLSILMFIYHINITNGKPLPYNAPNFFSSFPLGYVSMYVTNKNIRFVFAVILSVYFIFVTIFFRKKIINSIFIFPLFIHLLLWFIVNKLTGIYPSDRVLLPSVPLIIFSIIESFRWIIKVCKEHFQIVAIEKLFLFTKTILITFLLLFFLINININKTVNWESNYEVRDIAFDALINKRPLNDVDLPFSQRISYEFYKNKFIYFYNYDISTENN